MFLRGIIASAVRRKTLTILCSFLVAAFGVSALFDLPLSEFPKNKAKNIEISTTFIGASAAIVESEITRMIEENVYGVEGIKTIQSTSRDSLSTVKLELKPGENPTFVLADLREAIQALADDLPAGSELPQVAISDDLNPVVVWLNLTSDIHGDEELTRYAETTLASRLRKIEGVASIRFAGIVEYAVKVKLDRLKLRSHNLSIQDVENAIKSVVRSSNSGEIETKNRLYSIQIQSEVNSVDDFRRIVVVAGQDGNNILLGDVATVGISARDDRSLYRGNGENTLGLGLTREDGASAIALSRATTEFLEQQVDALPDGMNLTVAYDSSTFVAESFVELIKTLVVTVFLVSLIILIFLKSARATLIPLIAFPVIFSGTLIVLNALDMSLNKVTLLGLVLAVGLIVDDIIVVIERIERKGANARLQADELAISSTSEISHAIIATTVALIAVFIPAGFYSGDVGLLFREFSVSLSVAVAISSVIALTLTPCLGSFLLVEKEGAVAVNEEPHLDHVAKKTIIDLAYAPVISWVLRNPIKVIILFGVVAAFGGSLASNIKREQTPLEDRGAFAVVVFGPPGATFEYMTPHIDEIESILLDYVEAGEAKRVITRYPTAEFSGFESGRLIVSLASWRQRRSAPEIVREVNAKLAAISSVSAFAIMPQGFGSRATKPVQIVLSGDSYATLIEARDELIGDFLNRGVEIRAIDSNHKESQPQIQVSTDWVRSADLGVARDDLLTVIGTIFGTREIERWEYHGQEYRVFLEGLESQVTSPEDLLFWDVRSKHSEALVPLSSVIQKEVIGGSSSLNRYEGSRSITVEAALQPDASLDQVLKNVELSARNVLPNGVELEFAGESASFQDGVTQANQMILFGCLAVFVILFFLFNEFASSVSILVTAPIALIGALIGLKIHDATINAFTLFTFLILIGLNSKNGVLLLDAYRSKKGESEEHIDRFREACFDRLRPIAMTGLTTAIGIVPLLIASGPGSQTRQAIGASMFYGVTLSVLVSLLLLPAVRQLAWRFTR